MLRMSEPELDQVCRDGARWALKHGYASEADLRRTEEGGRLEGADPDKVSKRAKERGRPQLGTLGAGNHFIEVDVVDQIFDAAAAQAMGLVEGNLVFKSTAARAVLVTRSARTMWKISRMPSAATISTCLTGSWYVRRSTRRRAKLPGRHALRRQLCVCQPAGAGALCPAGLRGGFCREGEALATAPGVRYRPQHG